MRNNFRKSHNKPVVLEETQLISDPNISGLLEILQRKGFFSLELHSVYFVSVMLSNDYTGLQKIKNKNQVPMFFEWI